MNCQTCGQDHHHYAVRHRDSDAPLYEGDLLTEAERLWDALVERWCLEHPGVPTHRHPYYTVDLTLHAGQARP